MTSPAEYLKRARELEKSAHPARTLGVLASFSAQFLEPYLIVESAETGVLVRPWFGPFNQFEQEIFEPESELWHHQPDVLWIALRIGDVDPLLVVDYPVLGVDAAAERVSSIRRRLICLARGARGRFSGPILVSNLVSPSPLPLFDASDPHGLGHRIAAENRELARDLVEVPDAHVFDFAGLVAAEGGSGFEDARLWHMARIPCAAIHQPVWARQMARAIRALVRPAAKCVVLDLDNTLWGGVVGDDGVAGIQVGDEAPGSIYKAFQRQILGLRNRGFLLAVASKNERETAMEALRDHPEMLLRPGHFSAIEVGWTPKADSLRRIAKQLNIGLDSLVFVDDNPIERAAVRSELPEVMVVELPSNPLGFGMALCNLPLLDRVRLESEDLRRAEMYHEESRRRGLAEQVADAEEFLRDLRMVARVGLADGLTLARIHQLVNKTNQFNLTTRRRSLEDLHQLSSAEGARVAWLRLEDRFGDMGLVCVGILRVEGGGVWEIDTFVMSCRVMGRHVEDAFLAYLAELARSGGGVRLRGSFVPTAKNTLVSGFYRNHGFTAVHEDAQGGVFEHELGDLSITWPGVIGREGKGVL